MSKAETKEPSKSPIKDKVAVATKHRGVFMETAEFEAETGTKLNEDVEENNVEIPEENKSVEKTVDQEDEHVFAEVTLEPGTVKKKVPPRSKKKRFSLKKVSTVRLQNIAV